MVKQVEYARTCSKYSKRAADIVLLPFVALIDLSPSLEIL